MYLYIQSCWSCTFSHSLTQSRIIVQAKLQEIQA